MQTKENTKGGKKAEEKGKKEDVEEVTNEGKKAEDKGKEEDVVEVSKAGESWSRNVIITEEKARGGECAEEGLVYDTCRGGEKPVGGRGRLRWTEYSLG